MNDQIELLSATEYNADKQKARIDLGEIDFSSFPIEKEDSREYKIYTGTILIERIKV